MFERVYQMNKRQLGFIVCADYVLIRTIARHTIRPGEERTNNAAFLQKNKRFSLTISTKSITDRVVVFVSLACKCKYYQLGEVSNRNRNVIG